MLFIKDMEREEERGSLGKKASSILMTLMKSVSYHK